MNNLYSLSAHFALVGSERLGVGWFVGAGGPRGRAVRVYHLLLPELDLLVAPRIVGGVRLRLVVHDLLAVARARGLGWRGSLLVLYHRL